MKHINQFIFLATTLAAPVSIAQQTITISPLDKDHIQVEYQLPKQCSETSLQEGYEGRSPNLRKDWHALDNCSLLTNGETLTVPKGCHRSRFSVPMSTTFIDRVEPFAYPMGDLGVRIHTGTFGLTDKCGDTTWIFKSPKGSVVDESGIYANRFKASLSDKKYLHYTGVYLSYKPLKKDTQQIFTKTVPPELVNTINNGQALLSEYYKKTYPSIPFISPFLLIENIPNQHRFSYQAEVTSPHMIRFGYTGWSTDNIIDAQLSQAHEYAHLLQPMKHTPSSPFFHEGAAELISLKASYHLGWINKQTFSDRISYAIQRCINLSENKKWDDVKHSFGRIPYDCGLAMHVVALAARQQPESAEHTLEKYYSMNVDDSHFAKAIECGDQSVCKPHFIAEFTGNNKSISSVITEELDRLKLVTQISYANPKDFSRPAIGAAFANLMMEDCNGSDFYTQQNNFLIGEMLNCKNIPKKSTITSVNGINYFINPDAALDSQNQSCDATHKVILSNDKELKLEVPCSKTISKTYYSIDADKLLTLLDKRVNQ